jgi:hypothetical protein
MWWDERQLLPKKDATHHDARFNSQKASSINAHQDTGLSQGSLTATVDLDCPYVRWVGLLSTGHTATILHADLPKLRMISVTML